MTNQEVNEIWSKLKLLSRKDDEDGGAELIYQYNEMPLYLTIYAFDTEDIFDGGNTTYISDFDPRYDGDLLDTEEYYDLTREQMAQAISDNIIGTKTVVRGAETFGLSKDELKRMADELATKFELEDDFDDDSEPTIIH